MEKNAQVEYQDFMKLDIRVGTIMSAKIHTKSKIKAYVIQVRFEEDEVKTTIAQLTQNYQPDDLIGLQIAAITNFPPKRIGGIKSEALVLAAVDSNKGSILLSPTISAQEGSRVH